MGRDTFSRIVHGARMTLLAAAATLALSMTIALTVGILSGYRGGWADTALMGVVDLLLAFPSLIPALAVAGALGPGLFNVLLAAGAVWRVGHARIIRGVTLGARQMEYLMAARAAGAGNRRIILRHIAPNILGPIIVIASLDVGWIILGIAGLNFLGLGAQPPTPEWGAMLNDARPHLQTAPRLLLLPGTAIFLAGMGSTCWATGCETCWTPVPWGREADPRFCAPVRSGLFERGRPDTDVAVGGAYRGLITATSHQQFRGPDEQIGALNVTVPQQEFIHIEFRWVAQMAGFAARFMVDDAGGDQVQIVLGEKTCAAVNEHLTPRFGNLYLEDLSTRHIQQRQVMLLRGGMDAKGVRLVGTVLSGGIELRHLHGIRSTQPGPRRQASADPAKGDRPPSSETVVSASPSLSASTRACAISSRPFPKGSGRPFLTGWRAPPMWRRLNTQHLATGPTPAGAAHHTEGQAHSRLSTGPAYQLQISRVHHRPGGRHPGSGGRRNPTMGSGPRRDRERLRDPASSAGQALKYGLRLNHLPSGRFHANGAL